MASFSQLEIKKDNSTTLYENAGRQSLTQLINDQDTSYLLTFQDRSYTQIVKLESISFSNKAELVQFIELCEDILGGGDNVSTSKYSITGASKKWVTISNGIGDAYLKAKTILEIKEAIQ